MVPKAFPASGSALEKEGQNLQYVALALAPSLAITPLQDSAVPSVKWTADIRPLRGLTEGLSVVGARNHLGVPCVSWCELQLLLRLLCSAGSLKFVASQGSPLQVMKEGT